MTTITHAAVVEVFNRLGYQASFAAVAGELGENVKLLYARYPSREALGEDWLTSRVASIPSKPGLSGMFSKFAFELLRTLEDMRDFSRAWLAALKATGPLHLDRIKNLHAATASHFIAWLDANQGDISLPPGVRYEDVRLELADALCTVVLGIVAHWESDRSVKYGHTSKMVEAASHILDALLMRRKDLGDASLVVHLHALLDQQRLRFLKPLLEMWLTPERAGRYADPLSLLEVLRTLQPSPADRS